MNGFLERVIKFPMLGDTASQDGFEVCQIGHVDDLIDTVNERRHRVVRRETMAKQHDEEVAPARAGSSRYFGEDRVRLERAAFEVLVDDDDIVDVRFQLEDDVFGEEAEMHLVGNVDQLRHYDLLVLLMVYADQRRVIAEIEKCVCVLFHGSDLVKSVGLHIEAEPRIEVGIDAAGFLHEIDRARDLAFA